MNISKIDATFGGEGGKFAFLRTIFPRVNNDIYIYVYSYIHDDTVSVRESRFSPRFFTTIESSIAGILADILNGFVPFP